MNIILCVVAASILVNVAKSVRSAEEETGKVKSDLEQIKVKLESIEQKVPDHHEHQNNFKSTATDIGNAIETLNNSLKIFEQQRKAEAASSTHNDLAGTDPKAKLTTVLNKLPEVISKLSELKKLQANPKSDRFNGDTAIQYAGDFSKVLKVALEAEDKDINFEDLRKKASTLSQRITQLSKVVVVPVIPTPTKSKTENKQNPKVKQLQQSLLTTAEEIEKIIQNLNV